MAERLDHGSFSTMPQRLARCSASRGRTWSRSCGLRGGQHGRGCFLKLAQRLEQKFDITGDDLVMVMSNFVAIRLAAISFLTALRRLEREFGLTGKNPVTFLRDSDAIQLGDDSFFRSLQQLKQELGVTGRTWSRS